MKCSTLVITFLSTLSLSMAKPLDAQGSVKKSSGHYFAPMKPVWAWFGYDEPNYTYMEDGKKLLSRSPH